MAASAGLQTETISRAENGHLCPSLPSLAAIATALGCGLADIVDADRPLPPPDLSPADTEMLGAWRRLSQRERGAVLALVVGLRPK